MAYNSTTWSPEAITKASESTVGTTNDLTLSGDLTVNGADITIGIDADGTDRSVVFGHSTLKSIIGIDDSQDKFAINTDGTFETTNDLEIDSSGNVVIGNGNLSVFGDVIISGGKITFGNGEIFHNEDDGTLKANSLSFELDSSSSAYIISNSADGTPGSFVLAEDGSTKWSMGRSTSDTKLYFGIGNPLATVSPKLTLDTSGNMTVVGQFACNGKTPAAPEDYTLADMGTRVRALNYDTSSAATVRKCLASLIDDLIDIGILQ